VADAHLLREAVQVSLDHLRPWMPWALSEPSTLDETKDRLRAYEAKFNAGEDFVYGIFNPAESRVIGGTGLHTRVGPRALEIGYWIRVDETRRGFATESTKALMSAGLGLPGIERIEIHCDPNNTMSRRVPERLGFRLLEVRRGDKLTAAGEPRDTMVFGITAAE
jgi:RimJ/RimL family protein N-acetyltransferase